MSRGRHARRSPLVRWLLSLGTRRRLSGSGAGTGVAGVDPAAAGRLAALESQVSGLVELAAKEAADATAAAVRADRAEQLLVAAHREMLALQTSFTALSEELVWAFAEGRLSASGPVAGAQVIDLRGSHTA